jgi:hypothetical protein
MALEMHDIRARSMPPEATQEYPSKLAYLHGRHGKISNEAQGFRGKNYHIDNYTVIKKINLLLDGTKA